jgi:hypothetical protein
MDFPNSAKLSVKQYDNAKSNCNNQSGFNILINQYLMVEQLGIRYWYIQFAAPHFRQTTQTEQF